MKILVFSDLHFANDDFSSRILQNIEKIGDSEKPDALLLCGDNAEVSSNFHTQRYLFNFLRNKFDCSIGFVAGNHDLWTARLGIKSETVLHEILPEIAEKSGLEYLENRIMQIGKWSITGTYGHYDYSLAGLSDKVTMQDVKNFYLSFGGKTIYWMDGKFLNFSKSDNEVCSELILGLEERVKNLKENIITISHIIPTRNLSGHKPSINNDFVNAYSGSKKLEILLKKYPIDFHFCGHTHKPAEEKIGDCIVTNLGSDFETLRYAVLDTDSGQNQKNHLVYHTLKVGF